MPLASTKLILHSNLQENEILEAGWSFKYLDEADKIKAQGINCLEIKIDDLKDEDRVYKQALRFREKIAGHILDGRLGYAYLVLVQYQTFPKSRIRSYKGLFPSEGQIKKGDYLEFEFEGESGETFFMGISPITKDNRDESFAIAKDYMRAFILISREQDTNVYTREFLESVITCLDIKGNIIMNPMKLIPKACEQGLMILKFSSGQCGEYVSISSFYSKLTGWVERDLKQAVSEVLSDVQDN